MKPGKPGNPVPAPGGTVIRRREQHRDRWSVAGRTAGILSISELLAPQELRALPVFSEFDDAFLTKISPDVALAAWRPGSILFEEGSYLDVAFFILEGQVELYLEIHRMSTAQTASIFAAGPGSSPRGPGTTLVAPPGEAGGESVLRTQLRRAEAETNITFLSTLDVNLPTGDRALLGPGEILGEIGAMSGWPQSATARTVTECRLLQIRVPALRMLRRRSRSLRERLDAVYRARTLGGQIKATPLFSDLSEADLRELLRSAELVSLDPDQIATQEGSPADGIYMVRSGFVKLSQRIASGSLAVTYLSKGMTFGEPESLVPGCETWSATVSSMQYAELVRFPAETVRRLAAANPELESRLWTGALRRLEAMGAARRDLRSPELLDAALETGLLQGNSVLVIDLNRCTRCDDCVKGCSDTHGGIPRFVREGDKVQNLLVAKACYHCRDPLCLVGCPTGAIRRAEVGAVVEIKESLCIGCSACAENCPYDAIVMMDTGGTWPADAVPEMLRGKPRRVASKCDLCHTSPQGPACVRSCPNGCAFRVGSLDEVQALLDGE